jgi:MraZ protein
MTWGIDQCIYIMTLSAYEDFEKTLRNSREFSREWRILENKHFAQAMKVEIDKAGRVAIPPTFRKYARLNRDCTVINSAKGFLSVWDADNFFNYIEENNPTAQAVFDKPESGNMAGEGME